MRWRHATISKSVTIVTSHMTRLNFGMDAKFHFQIVSNCSFVQLHKLLAKREDPLDRTKSFVSKESCFVSFISSGIGKCLSH